MDRADSNPQGSGAASVRPAAVAGLFYPQPAETLRGAVDRLLALAERAHPLQSAAPPKALIVPHAGYRYSGAIAAAGYARLRPLRSRIRRVVLLGPSHRVPLRGMAVASVDAFATPLGNVPLDSVARAAVEDLPAVRVDDAPHALDHAIEVQLPFLQRCLDRFHLIPVSVGNCAAQTVARLLDELWGDEDTLIVVSTDLSHFHPYDQAHDIDGATIERILHRAHDIAGEQACGCHALNGLMLAAHRYDLQVDLVDCCNSGDSGGGLERVVGYASFVLHQS
ncbi:MAG: AmmeMemoRadiSam system protein B [Gammaproteobacteria bacterium]|nr:AmmeMemoRadiSam system protein B [Gammaproteobacteria bacterium]